MSSYPNPPPSFGWLWDKSGELAGLVLSTNPKQCRLVVRITLPSGWWFYHLEKYISEWKGLSHLLFFFQTTNQPWLCWINISRKPSNLWNNQRSLQMGYCISEMFGNAIWPKSARLSSGWASAHWFAAMYRLTDMAMEPIATALAKLKIYESYVYIYMYIAALALLYM